MAVLAPICGIGVGEGAALGRLCWLGEDMMRAASVRAVRTPAEERARFETALARAMAELDRLAAEARSDVGEDAAQIFATHAMIAEDPDFTDPVYARIADGESAEQAVIGASEELAARFRGMEDEYLRARAADFADIAARLCDGLSDAAPVEEALPDGDEPLIIAARDLTPSRTIRLDRSRIAGFVTLAGSPGSHTAILARSLGLPALVGVGEVGLAALDGARVLLDAAAGCLTVDPDPTALAAFSAREEARSAVEAARHAMVELPAETRSGRRIRLYANIGHPDEAAHAVAAGAGGVGLFRSEFLYLDRAAPPDEAEQAAAYRAAAEALGDRPLIIRTLDIGADKRAECIELPPEENPAMGLRAIRLCLRRRDLFRTQLRAICRVAGERPGQVGVMFPMIALVGELLEARAVLAEVQTELGEAGVSVDDSLEVGMMIETPAAALCAAELAPLVDFFSVGSNDLVQYTLAVDRLNGAVAELAAGLPAAVGRLIAMAAEAIHAAGGWIGLCGELAADETLVGDLLALGLDELSVAPAHLGRIKEAIRGCE